MIQHPVPDEHLKYIGDMTVSFALLESALQSLIGSLIFEHQRIGQIITAQLSFKNLRALLYSLYLERHGKDDEDIEQLTSLLKRAAVIEEERNQITHSVWGAGIDPQSVTRMKTTIREKAGYRFRHKSVHLDDLKAFAQDIKVLTHEFINLQWSLMERGKLVNNPGKKIWPPGSD